MRTHRRRLFLFCLFMLLVMYLHHYDLEQRLMGWCVIIGWVSAFIATYIRGVKTWQ